MFVITVAGMSTRFSRSIGRECIKCLYHEGNVQESLLGRLLSLGKEFDRIVIVGGFRYAELVEMVMESFPAERDRILFVENPKYSEYGSGYSLFLGLEKALSLYPEEIVFAEGDLFLDETSFQKVFQSGKPVITVNAEVIRANKSVVFYYDREYGIHYLYDLRHNELEIAEPFVEIYNSGQVWKFQVNDLFYQAYSQMKEEDWQGTNLVFVQRYFETLGRAEYEILPFQSWINCNTISDFQQMKISSNAKGVAANGKQ